MQFVAKYMGRWRAFTLTALVLVSLSCASHDPLKLQFDPEVDAFERADFLEGMATWNAVTTPDYGMFVVDDNAQPDGDTWRLSFVDHIPYLASEPEPEGRTCRAQGDFCPNERQIRLRMGLPSWRYVPAATHELGHALGLEHVLDPNSVMAPNSPTSVLSPDDIDECVRVGACGSITVRRIP